MKFSQLKSSGFEIIGEKAVKEQYRVQAIKEAIIEEDLRPTLPTILPTFFKIATLKCWLKDPSQRPLLSQLEEIFSQKLQQTEEEWGKYCSNPEEEDYSESEELTMRLNNSKRFFEKTKPEEYPIRITFNNITLITLKGKCVQLVIRFRGKSFYSSKLKIPTRRKILKLEFKDKAVSRLTLDTICTSILQLHVLTGSYKMSQFCRTEIYLVCLLDKCNSQYVMIFTTKDGTRNGTATVSYTTEVINSM